MDVSAVVVSFNTKEKLRDCLASLRESSKGLAAEVIVVDNASQDGSADMAASEFPEARLVRNPENRYFTGANNQGLKLAQGRNILVLNSDTRVLADSLKLMSGYLDAHPETGAVTCRMEYPDGRFYQNGARDYTPLLAVLNCTFVGALFPGWKARANAPYTYQGLDWTRDQEVEVAGDCNLMVRASSLREAGLYDQSMKLYYTENELCIRLRKMGLKIVALAGGRVVHHLRGTVSQSGLKKISKIYEEDTLAYFRKFHGTACAAWLWMLIALTNLLLTVKSGAGRNIFETFLTDKKAEGKN